MRTSPGREGRRQGARYADIARARGMRTSPGREVCGHRQGARGMRASPGARGMRASPGRERHAGIVRARGMRASPGRERHAGVARDRHRSSPRERHRSSPRERDRQAFPAEWAVAAEIVEQVVLQSGRWQRKLWNKLCDSGILKHQYDERRLPLEHLGDEVIQALRVEGGPQGVELLSEWSPEGDRLFLSLRGDRLFSVLIADRLFWVF
ncbi:hypothetical protein VNO80_13218 [Phaseolus coccineus]|uniref:Uncharacterized protein n=1 Tax=Phaseolus coccineus TaxID=3886 RepID=A0AAN9RB41_PHACN